MASIEILRLHYYERQYLGAADLEDQQAYLRDMRRRHNLAHHVWGIVTGLDLVEVPVAGDPTAVDVYIQPGMAIDGFGREIIVLAPTKLDPLEFAAFSDDNHRSVWIAYDQQLANQATGGFAQCNAANQFSRVEETFTIEVQPKNPLHDDVIVDGQPVNPTSTNITIPPDDSVPYQEFPDDAEDHLWPLQLGSVHWDGTAGQQKFKPATPPARLSEGRAYAGVVAQTIYSPAAEPVVDPKNPSPADDVPRFFIQPRTPQADPDAAGFAEVIGRLQVDGRIVAEKDVFVNGGKVRLQDSSGSDNGAPLWLQRLSVGAGFDLRAHIGDKPNQGNRLSVGTGPSAGPEKTTFAVKDDDSVDIPSGSLTFGPTPRQMITFTQPAFGIGVQGNALFERSNGDFRWFDGTTDAASGDPLMSLTAGGTLYVKGNVGVGTPTPGAQMHVTGGQWDLGNSEGDLKIGDNNFRLKIGVALGGGGAGDVRIRAQGGTSRLILGSGTVDTLTIQNSNLGLGTLSPQKMLSVGGGMNIDQANANNGLVDPGLTFGSFSGEGIASKRTPTGNQFGLDIYTDFVPRLSITNGGLIGLGTSAPVERLDVRGNIKLGSGGALFAPGGMENLAIVRGTINSNGTANAGTGFTISRVAAGAYLIKFAQPFASRPSASATQIFPAADDFGAGGDSRDNAVICGLNATEMKVITGNNAGAHEDRSFTFIVIGPR